MRTTFLLLTLTITSVFATNIRSQEAKASIQAQNISVYNVLNQIEKQTDYLFVYDKQEVDLNRRVNINVINKPVAEILSYLFRDTNITYAQEGTNILLMQKAVSVQKQKISGTVIDSSNGLPLPGVSVRVDGTYIGTITDSDGKFSIDAPSADAALMFSFIGYNTEKVQLNGQVVLNISLSPDVKKLDEVVVIGYGTKLKGDLTGAISKVDNKAFESRPITNTFNALQGEIPGVTITRGSGQPGNEDYSLQIRGISSINGNKSLILIDGVPGDMNLLNPADIESISVLKDAAAAIYGARAADGVVIITTKKGKKGAPTIFYSGNFGVKTPTFLKQRTNTLQLAEMYDEGMRNIGLPGVTQDVFNKIKSNAAPDPSGWLKYLENFPGFYGSHDWNDEVYGTGVQQSHNLSISGGGDQTNYLFSAGYERNSGVFKHGKNYSDRYNLRMNYDFKLFDRINIETRTNFDKLANVEPSGLSNILYYVNQVGSYVPVYNPLGEFYKYQGGFRNPVQFLEQSGIHKNNTYQFGTNAKVDIKIFNDLKFVAQGGIKLAFNNESTTHPSFNEYNWDGTLFDVVNSTNRATYSNYNNTYGMLNAYLEYNKTIANKHQINLMVGTSEEKNDYSSQSITGYNFASNELFTLNLADRTKSEYANFTGNATDWLLKSCFSRASYSFERKYLVDFTTRIDGSSKFAPSKRWSALFPSVALAWNLSEEDFVKLLNVFDNLKVRASWGKSGNQDLSFGNYDYVSLISISGTYPLGVPNAGLPGAIPNIASSERTWETIETKNVGLDFSLIKSKLTGSFDYYIKYNNDMLVNEQLPALLGGDAPTQNVGKLRTTGWDFSIGWSDTKGDFKYSISALLSDSRNRLVELKGNDTYYEGLVTTRKGYALNSYFGYKYEGIIRNQEQLDAYKQLGGSVPYNIGLGDVMYKDVDGDGQITEFGNATNGTKGDMVYLGNLNPRYTYSSNINLSYKHFDLNVILQGVGKRSGIREGEFAYPFVEVWMQPLKYFYGKNWSADNPNAKYPRIIPGYVGFDELRYWNWRTSALQMVNLAYLNLKVVTLAYNLPQPLCSKMNMQNARVYISGEDLFTFSKDTWDHSWNPEDTWGNHMDETTYPFSRVVSVGVDIKF